MSDDAEFDAFLKREDDLSRRLRDAPQAVPSAALDAAILQRARELMAQEAARPAAANDAGPRTPAPRLGWRWRVPAGIAATVLAGVFARQAYLASADRDRDLAMPPSADQREQIQPAPSAAPPPMMETAPPPKPETRAPARDKAVRAPAPVAAPAPVVEEYKAPPPAPVAAPAPAVEEYKVAPAAPEVLGGYAAPAPLQRPAFAPAPAAAPSRGMLDSAEKPAPQAGIVQRVDAYSANARSAVQAKAQEQVRAPAPWLAAIEALLEAGKDAEVAHEWRSFRQAYPDYPVPQTTAERIKAIAR